MPRQLTQRALVKALKKATTYALRYGVDANTLSEDDWSDYDNDMSYVKAVMSEIDKLLAVDLNSELSGFTKVEAHRSGKVEGLTEALKLIAKNEDRQNGIDQLMTLIDATAAKPLVTA